jgi:hypothetical protein
MTTSSMLNRIAKLEKRQKRHSADISETALARWVGFCLSCAANGYGSEAQRDQER